MRNNTRAIMMTATVGLMIGYWYPFSAAVARQPSPVASENGGDNGAFLAWICFEKAEKTYAEIPYLWLGDVNINLDIDVKPSRGHALHLRWGSKNDARQALVTITG